MLPLTIFFVWAFLAWTALYPHFNPYSYAYVGVTLVVVIALRDTLRWEMELGWMIAWSQFFLSMHFVLVPDLHFIWNSTWLALLTGLWYLLRPSNGWVFFLLFSTIAASQRWVFYTLYLFYWLHPDKSSLPPFSFFAHLVRRPKPPLKRPDSPADSNIADICRRCQGFIYSSRLIMGSSLPIVRLAEWYAHYDTMKQLRDSAKGVHSDPNDSFSACFVCNLLLLSVSEKRMEATRWAAKRLRVKVWDERPLSLHTYVQLHIGKHAVGARLLVERGASVQTASPAASEPTTNSAAHWEQANQWISQCQEHHSLCGTPFGTGSFLPTRLLYVEKPTDPTGTPQLRLVITAKEMALNGTSPPYIAFSHCWGPRVPLMLKKNNLQQFCGINGIPFERISQSMQDALHAVLGLGYAYLWIDSLCIIQDDPEDWACESKKMADVYAGAICTIAATASTSGEGGCFRTRDPSALRAYQLSGEQGNVGRTRRPDEEGEEESYEGETTSVHSHEGSVISIRFDDGFDFERYVDRSPLNGRGWVFQERLLSPRILHFGARMLYWECWQRSASEVFPHGYVYKRYPDDFVDDYAPRITWISSREQLEEAERDGQGLYWSYQRGILDRPPAPADDPDAELPWDKNKEERKPTPRGQTLRFWNNIRKASLDSWMDDTEEASGFRDSFWRLLMAHHSANEVGPDSFTHTWYQMVQTYSRGRLTFAKDKLVAFSAIVNALQRNNRYTYLAGIWRESLLPGLVWFVQEGSSRSRLTMVWPENIGNANPNQDRVHVCPTWSWASLEGIIDIHLVPENAQYQIRMSRAMATVEDVTITSSSSSDTSSSVPLQGTLVIAGPLFPISKLPALGARYRQKIWLDIAVNRPVWAWFMRDTDEKVDDCDFFCLPLLELETSINFDDDDDDEKPSWEIQGLVLSRSRGSEVFQRRGLFVLGSKHSNDKVRNALGKKDKVITKIV